ncbi:MAG: dolichyl-phosphooligosaccharide-protein glycotransferase [Acidobacteriota bacterium]|jgi:dolichyl-diphosphooligosaccharide--protein glycosyltransferase|nr:dolichyl-phosphooligosaccharide-protein glycotransferase [Acidobacteriota bacterium]
MRRRAWLLLILLIAIALRLGTWRQTFAHGRVYIDGPDGWYHLRRAAMTMAEWPHVPQSDALLNAPVGGLISWPPLFDGMLATLALPFGSGLGLDVVGAFLPPLLGVLQLIALYALVKRLRCARAGIVAAAVAAVLPGVVRYTLLGALDHDPFFSLCNLVALIAIADEESSQRKRIAILAAALSAAILGWTGAVVGVAIVTCAALATGSRAAARVLAYGSAIAAIVILPFVLTSVWRGATFEGLSLLHVAALVGASVSGAAFAREWRLFGVASIAAIALLPIAIVPFIRGVRYAAGDAPILAMVEEAQPLLRLFGTFDVRPLLIRLGFLPLAAIFFLRNRFVGVWVVITFTLAMLHSRFTFDAALALCAFAGLAIDDALRVHRRALVAAVALLVLSPALAAYAGGSRYNLFARENALRTYEMDAICDALRNAPNGVVLAPWQFGHWIVRIANKPVVVSPMLSVGQSEFAPAMRFSFAEDARSARAFLDAHRVRYVIVTPEAGSIEARARVAGVDPARYIRDGHIEPRSYMRTLGAQLTYGARVDGYREVLRSRTFVPGPFGAIPLVRVYEVVR